MKGTMTRPLDRLRRALGVAAIGAALGLAALPPGPARAASAEDQAAYDAAFDQMQRDPGNSDKALAYAEAAIKVGDLEGAIGALERLLIFNPDLPRIRLEIGVLYFRLGSYDLARNYLTMVTERTDISEDIRAKAQDYLAQIDRQSSPHRIGGNVTAGFRYQSNANFGPSGSGVTILGLNLPVASNVAPKGDGAFVGLGALNYVYDFQRADPVTIETNLTVYGSKQFRQTFLDLSLTQIDVGPRFGLPNLLEGASVRPYVVGDYLSLGGSHYMASYGGGVNGVAPVIDRLNLVANFEIQNRQYYMDVARPRIEDRSGNYIAFRVSPQYALADNQIVGFLAEVDRTEAHQAYERNWQLALGPSYQIRFLSPIPETGLVRPWTGSIGFFHVWRWYDQPDIIVDPFHTRNDSEYNLGGTLELPIIEGLSALLQAQQTWAYSNVQNYKYTNTTGLVALSFSF
jgi:hypothetical protein